MTARSDDLLAPYLPSTEDPFDLIKAGHLLRRTGFGASLRERKKAVSEGLEATLAEVLAPAEADPFAEFLEDVLARDEIERVRAWRFLVMLASPHRLRVRMSLFWHQHFATSNAKVGKPGWMARQQETFDRLGLGSFDELLLAAAQEPAMLRWLDAESSHKGRPNENFARELMELFALGRGHYGERDVQEAARAFTGWQVRDGRFREFAPWHDGGTKTVLGVTGPLRGEDVVRHVAGHAASARFLARKLLVEFVHPEPTEPEIAALAERWTREGHHVGRTLGALFASRLFFSPRALRSRVPSPVEFVLTVVRSLGARAAPAALARAAGRLGQVLLEPPTVEGWVEGRAWLTSATWILRRNFVVDLLRNEHGFHLAPRVEALFAKSAAPAARADLALAIVLDGAVDAATRLRIREFAADPVCQGDGGIVTLLQAVWSLPEAQLA